MAGLSCADVDEGVAANYRDLITSEVFHAGLDLPHEHDDLEGEAWVAFYEALDRFEPERGCEFSTYAVSRIRGSLRHYRRDRTEIIKPSRNKPSYRFCELTDDLAAEEFDRDLSLEIEVALKRLDKQHALALRLHDLDGLGYQDVGRALGISREWARQIRNAGLRRLTELLAGGI